MKTIYIGAIAAFASLFFATQSFASTSQNKDWLFELSNAGSPQSSIEFTITKWWKFGYFGGGFGTGEEMKTCANQEKIASTFELALPVNTDFGLRFGDAAVGLRSNAKISTDGIVRMYYVHADVLF